MSKNKAYLHCIERQKAQSLWRQKLQASKYFDEFLVETMSAAKSLGRITASLIKAKQSVPHYNGSAMDGIAVWAADTFGALETLPKQLNLLSPGQLFRAGGCYLVDTGDLIPEGTNAVIMIEDVHIKDNKAEIVAAAAPWQHVRIIGEDIVANEMVVSEHKLITPEDIAAMLAAGIEEVLVIKKPRVAIIPTGDELVASSHELKPGAILDVNSHMLAAAIESWGGEANCSAIIKDQRAAIKEAVVSSLAVCDMVIVNAGTSAGTDDYTAEVLGELGEVIAHGIAIKPGKPVVLAICQGKPVIGLPGYPVSAMLTAELFVRDVLIARQRLPGIKAKLVETTLVKQVASAIGVEEFIRVSVGNVQGKMVCVPQGRGAGMLSSLTKAQGVISIDAASAGLNAGAVVTTTLLRQVEPLDTVLAIGSHDLSLDLLGVYLRRARNNISLFCANVGSMGGIMAVRSNETHIAGIHLLDAGTGEYNLSFVQKYLAGTNWELVHLAMRQQGLMVKPGNAKNIKGISDLTRQDVRFINRQRGSGTRMLLDYELTKAAIDSFSIAGYEKEVGTHMAVAASVLAGAADVGMGVKAAALALGLEFIPVAEEQYDLLLNFAADDERRELVLAILKSPEFQNEVEALGGYDLKRAGEILIGGRA
ncbi:MAG: molybdopterin biosynthesis protein [Pelosinus sp.]|nr:molybdopterin biosynthesis protein [Pelosinus sp.]